MGAGGGRLDFYRYWTGLCPSQVFRKKCMSRLQERYIILYQTRVLLWAFQCKMKIGGSEMARHNRIHKIIW